MKSLTNMAENREMVNHPTHYNNVPGVECIDVVRYFDFDRGNAIKYIWRAGSKPEMGMTAEEKEIEDLKKAIWYLEDRIVYLEGSSCK